MSQKSEVHLRGVPKVRCAHMGCPNYFCPRNPQLTHWYLQSVISLESTFLIDSEQCTRSSSRNFWGATGGTIWVFIFIILNFVYHIIMTRAKQTKRCKRKPPRSPLKDWRKRPPSFGKVKDLGEATVENIEKRSILKFLRQKHPEWSQRRMQEET